MNGHNYLSRIIKPTHFSAQVTFFDCFWYFVWNPPWFHCSCVFIALCVTGYPHTSACAGVSAVGLKEFVCLSVGEGRKWELAVWLCQAFPGLWFVHWLCSADTFAANDPNHLSHLQCITGRQCACASCERCVCVRVLVTGCIASLSTMSERCLRWYITWTHT